MKLVLRSAPLAAAAALLFAAPAFAADDNCESIRAGIEAKIRAGGVASFTLSTVDAQASAPGRVVGTCARGARKIVYSATAAAAASPAAPAAARRGETMITECRDGSSSVGGNCPK